MTHRHYFIFIWLIGVLVAVQVQVGQAQTVDFTIAYDETQSAFFDGDNFTQNWIFFGNAGDILTLRAFRIAGQFEPRLRLLDATGAELASTSEPPFADSDTLVFASGLPQDGPYQIEVNGRNPAPNQSDNPAEYSLSLELDGQRPSNLNDDLPLVGTQPIPDLEAGDPSFNRDLNINVFGATPEIFREDTPNVQARWVLQTPQWQLAVRNDPPVAGVISSVTFREDGIGTTLQLTDRRAAFFSDENFLVSYNATLFEYTFTLESGQTIVSDFFNVREIQVQNGIVAVTTAIGEQTQRLLFDSSTVNLQRFTQGPDEMAINRISLDEDARFIVTDLVDYHTLAYLGGQLRVIYNQGGRFITDIGRISALRQDRSAAGQHRIELQIPVPDAPEPRIIPLSVDWQRMGDIRLLDDQLDIVALDGLMTSEALVDVRGLVVEDRALRIARRDGSFRTVLPDGTAFETPAEPTLSDGALPHEFGFHPVNFNNLGEDFIPVCPCVSDVLENQPVNPANGNFFYKVTDFNIPSHTIALNLTRYYNSQGFSSTPDYMLNAPAGYRPGRMGDGWRHSYQYELDVRLAPLGQVRVILPSGAQHIFRSQAQNPTRYTSQTLRAWVIDQQEGVIGRWQATDIDGIRYHFDRAGRLQRISETRNRSLTLSPMPLTPQYADGWVDGVFITEPYGRRLELYSGASGRIELARDTSSRQIQYGYAGTQLSTVQYITALQTAAYQYNPQGILARFDDARSPYLRVGTIEYDERLRVARYAEMPDTIDRSFEYTYDEILPDTLNRITRRRTTVAGTLREAAWVYDARARLINRLTARSGYDFEFTYDENTGLLNSFRTPAQTRYRLQFDGRGNLLQLADPFLGTDNAYNFTYTTLGDRRLLTQISYPNGAVDSFTYTEGDNPQLATHRQLLNLDGLERETRYEYDDWGRLVLLVEPGSIATLYEYDSFGYVTAIWEGIELEAGETRSSISDSNRARRVLRLEHDLRGQLSAVIDGRGNTYALNWDNTLEQVRRITGPQGVSITFDYDERGNVTGVDDRGQVISYIYNALDLVDTQIDATGAAISYTYDTAGNLRSIADSPADSPQRATRFDYDELDQLVSRISPGGLVSMYSTIVNEAGEIVRRERDPIGRSITRKYDALGRLREYTIVEGDFQQVFRINYNLLNRPVSIEEVDGQSLTLEYDLLGQVLAASVQDSRTQFAYDLRGNLIQVTSPGGQVIRYTYDPLDNITQVDLPGEAEAPLRYEYDESSNLLRSTNAANLVTTYVYDALNQLLEVEDPEGNTESYTYDLRGNLQTLIDARDTPRNFAYDAMDRLLSVDTVITADASRQATTYQYDELGRLVGIDPPGISSTEFTYDVEDRIITVTENRGALRTLYGYDAIGRVISISDPLGHTHNFAYSALDRISRITDPVGDSETYRWRRGTLTDEMLRYVDIAGRSFSYNVDSLGRVTLIRDLTTDPNQAINTEIVYTPDGYIQSIQTGTDSARGSGQGDVQHQYEYSAQGWPTRYTDPAGGVWQLAYDADGNLTAVTNPRGFLTRYVYDGAGNVLRVVHYAGTDSEAAETFEYDANGNITAYVSPTGIVNAYEYDANNRLIRATLAVGTTEESTFLYEYSVLNQLVGITDPMGHVVRYFYEPAQLTLKRIEREVSGEPVSFEFNYDDVKNLTGVIPPEGIGQISQTYDALNRRVRYVNGEDNVWAYTYDEAGNIAQVSDPLGSIVQYNYDSNDRVRRITDPAGNVIQLTYSSNGNLRDVILPVNGGDETQTISYTQDVAGNLRQVQQGANTTRYEYDAMGKVIRRTQPDGSVTIYEYDAAGRLIATIYDDGSRITRAYDAEGRLRRVDDINLEYDSLNRLIRSSSPSGIINFTYDRVGNLIQRDAGPLGTVNYTYDALHRLTRIEMDGHSIAISYETDNQLIRFDRSNGVRTTVGFDTAGRTTSVQHFVPDGNTPPLDGFNYRYDAVGNLIRVDRILDSSRILYSYDVAHRLIDERWLNSQGETIYNASFRYDAAGNRIEEIRNGSRTVFQYNAQNQLVSEVRDFTRSDTRSLWLPSSLLLAGILFLQAKRHRYLLLFLLASMMVGLVSAQIGGSTMTNVSYEYDANGNMARAIFVREDGQRFELTLTYDRENRLVAVNGQNANGEPVNTVYEYDAMSRLVRWRVNETSDYQLFYADQTLIGMSNQADAGSSSDRFLDIDGERLLTITGGDRALWHLNDVLGSTRRFAAADGSLLREPSRQLEFGSFGVRIFPDSANIPPEQAQVDRLMPFFAGNLYDPATQLYLMGLRAYEATSGRFLQPDPVRQDPFGSLYTFARNRPFVFTDPTGMVVEPLLEPTQAADLLESIRPENMIPRLPLPDIPLPPAVHRLQEQESFRVLTLFDMLQFSTNDVVARLSPLLDDFYFFELNPMPQDRIALDAQPLRTMLSIYNAEQGWLPDPTTNPFEARNPFDLMEALEPRLERAFIRPLAWRWNTTQQFDPTIMPNIVIPTGLNEQWQKEAQLLHDLQALPLMANLQPNVAHLTHIVDNFPDPPLPNPTVAVPTAPVEPPLLEGLDSIREASFDLLRPILPLALSTCADCVPPLGFNR